MTRFEALPQTIVMVVEGAAFGGGLGLLCAGDVVLAAADAKFALSETGLGIPPAQIAPFVAARIGVARTRRLALTGDASTAARPNGSGWSTGPARTRRRCEAALAKRARRKCAAARRGANAAIKRLLLASRTPPREHCSTIGRRLRGLPARAGRAGGRHCIPGETQTEMDEHYEHSYHLAKA